MEEQLNAPGILAGGLYGFSVHCIDPNQVFRKYSNNNLESGTDYTYIYVRIKNEYMKLKPEVLQRLDNNRGLGLVMFTLGCSHSAARDYVKDNHDNLTKAAMLNALRDEFGLTDAEILEDETTKVAS